MQILEDYGPDAQHLVHPEFIRLPKPGQQCRWTGLSRSKLNELILPSSSNNFCPPVKSFSLRPRGAVRGTRLILLASLLEYLHGEAKAQDSFKEGGGV